MDILPNLTPEHAALLGQSERQRLATELNASYENLNRMAQEHDSTEDQWGQCYEQDAEWYLFCFEVGLAAYLANAITARAESLPQSEDNIEMASDAVGKCCQAAQESMEYARKNEPHADAPFPQTRQQTMERALNNSIELGLLDQRLQEKMEAVRSEADNSLAQCHLCRNATRADDIITHARSCVMAAIQRRFVSEDPHVTYAENGAILIRVRSNEMRHWMMLAVKPITSLRQLDQFLRDLQLKCCGYKSHFQTGSTRYTTCIPGQGDANPEDRHMDHTLAETVRTGKKFHHVFGHGDTTRADLECVATLAAPYHCLPELVDPPEADEGHADDLITVVARNLPPKRCFTCGETAGWHYHKKPYTQVPPEIGGPIVAPPYFCDECAPRDVVLTGLWNSPHNGTGCYDKVHHQP